VRPLALITLVDAKVLVPVVLSVAMVGSYAIDSNIENVIVTSVFGVLGYLMIRYDYPRLTVVIALVLGGTAERNFHQALMISDGHASVFFTRSISQILIACIVAWLSWPILSAYLRAGRKTAALPGESA
jgi:putative tricarboxylic transport membrane protein